jgi:hypothetical protein
LRAEGFSGSLPKSKFQLLIKIDQQKFSAVFFFFRFWSMTKTLDPDPDSREMLDPDPDSVNPDPWLCYFVRNYHLHYIQMIQYTHVGPNFSLEVVPVESFYITIQKINVTNSYLLAGN